MPSAKNTPYFVELNEFSLLMARTTATKPPLSVEDVMECSLHLPLDQVVDKVQQFGGIGAGQFIQAVCGIYPSSRMIRRQSLENPAKTRDPAFLPQYLSKELKLDLTKYMATVLNAGGGAGFDPEVQLTKDIVFCGALRDDIVQTQQELVDRAIFPTRVEVGSLATIGGVSDYMAMTEASMPTLILELGATQATVLIVNGNKLDIARPIPHGLESMYPVVQKELGLKDQESARKLFSSSTFDFTEMGGTLLKKLLKELQASTGFYEVQTGMTIGQLHVSGLPANLGWIATTLSRTLGVEVLKPDYERWFERLDINIDSGIELANLDGGWFGLFSLMGRYQPPAK
jgi:hypothetical protein